MGKINEIYQECNFDNLDILVVAEKILSRVKSAKIERNSDNELVISKDKHIFIIDKIADVQHIKTGGENEEYSVYYFVDGIDYKKLLKGF